MLSGARSNHRLPCILLPGCGGRQTTARRRREKIKNRLPELVPAPGGAVVRSYLPTISAVSFLFCFMGYYNGCEKTLFVMIQGIIGAFGVRIPIAYLVSRIPGATLFQIGLGTPASSTVQIVLCLAMFLYLERRQRREALCGAVTGP